MAAYTFLFLTDAGAAAASPDVVECMSDAEALGRVLYTRYVYFFEVAGLVLLVAMIGAIVLSLHRKAGVKRQRVADQIARTPATAIEIKHVQSGQGI